MANTILGTEHNPCLNANLSLGIDEACLSIVNFYNRSIKFYSRPQECYLCNGVPTRDLDANSNTTFVIPTKYPLHIYYTDVRDWCHTTYNFKEHGSYGWNISQSIICSEIYTLREPEYPYYSLIVTILGLLIGILSWMILSLIVSKIKGRLAPRLLQEDLDGLQEPDNVILNVIARHVTRVATRIHSVDAFRGFAVLLMIFVNNGGGKYVFFEHSAWFGLTIADLVLPWFAWIMGLTITISTRSELRATTPRPMIIGRNFLRALKLVLLGLMINSISSGSLSNLRFPGVLQLLGVTYFVCASMETIFMKTDAQDNLLQYGRLNVIRDILQSWRQWSVVLLIIAAHSFITFLYPVPNCPRGYLGPGGYHVFGRYANCTAGAAGYIDRTIFGNHMYAKTEDPVYGHIARYDPEGLMNTISAILIVYLGVHAGKILYLYYQCHSRVIRWLLWATFTGILAGILCNFDKEEGVIPVSKKMMTLSFVLTTSSFAFILFSLFYVLIDYKQCWSGAPFIYAGSSPIFLYVGHILTKDLFPWAWTIHHPTHDSIFQMNVWSTALWGLIAFVLYKKDIVITV